MSFQLAGELRLLRGTAGLSGKEAAARLGWSPSKVSRIEIGRIGVNGDDLERLLALYGVAESRVERIRRFAASVRSKGWWDAYADALSPEYANLIKLETGSRALQCYSAVVPHALLQTPDYARHVIRSTLQGPSQAEIDRRLDIHRRRQALVRQPNPPLRLTAIIDEAVFRRRITGQDGRVDAATTRAQFESLVDAANLPNVSVQVLTFKAGLPPVTAGSFSILESPATEGPDVVYLENKTRIFFVDSESEVYWYTQDFDMLSTMALSPGESLDYIRQEMVNL